MERSSYLDTLFQGVGAAGLTRVVASSTEYLSALDGIISTGSAEALTDYLRWQTIRMAMPHLSLEFTAEAERFTKELYLL